MVENIKYIKKITVFSECTIPNLKAHKVKKPEYLFFFTLPAACIFKHANKLSVINFYGVTRFILCINL